MAPAAIAGIFILAITCGVGFGVASADSSDDLARAGAFGFDEATHAATLATAASASSESASSPSGQAVLAATSARDISIGLQMVDQREAEAAQQAEAEKVAALERVGVEKAMQGVVVEEPAEAPAPETVEYNLPAVDWTVGKDAFVAEWAARIDAYLAGSPLSGYGAVFAEAAWDSGVDPRWSPAISNTESSKGTHCFLPCNAWGWGVNSWSDWESAIRAHAAGLAAGYGYSLTLEAAQKYCPPNSAYWYSNTAAQMALI